MSSITKLLNYYNHKIIKTTVDAKYLNHHCALKYRDAIDGLDYTTSQKDIYRKKGFEQIYVFDIIYDNGDGLMNQLIGLEKSDKITTLTHLNAKGKVQWSMTFERIK